MWPPESSQTFGRYPEPCFLLFSGQSCPTRTKVAASQKVWPSHSSGSRASGHLLKARAGDKVCLLKLRMVPSGCHRNISWDCRVKGACPWVRNSLGLLRIQQCSFIKGSRGLVSDLKTWGEGDCRGGEGAKSAHPQVLPSVFALSRLSCAPTSHPDSADNSYNSCSSHQKTRYKQTSIDLTERKASTQSFTREEANWLLPLGQPCHSGLSSGPLHEPVC